MSPQFLLRSIAVLALGAGGVNLAHAVSPDAGTMGTPEDQTAQLADASPPAEHTHTQVAPGKVTAVGGDSAAMRGPAQTGLNSAVQGGTPAGKPQDHVVDRGRTHAGADRVGQPVASGREVVHADLDRRTQDKPKIRSKVTRPTRKGPSSAGYVSRLAAAPSSRADILCNDLDYLKRRLQRKGVDMSGIQVELHRHHDRARKARFIMARSSSQATLRTFSAEVGDLRAKKVRLPLVADPGELESAGLYRRCSCANGKAKCS